MNGMNTISRLLMALLAIILSATPALSATFEFHGDLNHRFNLYTNHADFYGSGGLENGVDDSQVIGESTVNSTWGEIKYRLWTEAATNDGNVKGVYAIELGGLRFGDEDYSKGGGATYSGDGVNIETRWAYTAFLLPETENAWFKMGLLPFAINDFVWNETAMGVVFTNSEGGIDYQVAWVRGREYYNDDDTKDKDSADALSARFTLKPMDGGKLGLFAMYQHADPDAGPGAVDAGKYEVKKLGDVEMDIYTLGVDGGMTTDSLFVNWDAIYQMGEINNATFKGLNGTAAGDFDLAGFLVHGDVGMNMGANRLTYTAWYASGDDKDTDNDFDAFMSTDVDRTESIVLFEGGYTDDNYGTERPYILNKGLFLNRIAFDRECSAKLDVGGAALYMMTAEDIEYTDDNAKAQSNSDVGFELDAYATYKLYENLEVAINAGYLLAGDAMDAFEKKRDGSADEDIYRITSRVRYKF